MSDDLYDWRDREPNDDEFAVMRALSDVRMGKGVMSDADLRLDKFLHREAVEFMAMFLALNERLFTQAGFPLVPMIEADDPAFAEVPVRATAESVEFAALRDLVRLIDEAGGAYNLATSFGAAPNRLTWESAMLNATARARAIVIGSPMAPKP